MFNLKYSLQDIHSAEKDVNLKAFGTFICAGGSSIGYKLAGFNHLGGVEIDPRCAKIYQSNLRPKYLFVEDIRLFNERTDLPAELYSLDLLDGSPPCSLFSMSGSREKAWGKEKKFREGQSNQTLDDLVFVYIKTIEKLRPKVAILENVAGLIFGAGRAYAKQIVSKIDAIGYDVQVFDLNSASMGLPQARRRIFFVCRRKDLKWQNLKLQFNSKGIPFGEIKSLYGKPISSDYAKTIRQHKISSDRCAADVFKRVTGRTTGFNYKLVWDHRICPTIVAHGGYYRANDDELFSESDFVTCGTFPQDYDFNGAAQYFVGMSVPPLMMAHLSSEIRKQWFS
jgi:DNA (cytosine-5)-methyltransferase 1